MTEGEKIFRERFSDFAKYFSMTDPRSQKILPYSDAHLSILFDMLSRYLNDYGHTVKVSVIRHRSKKVLAWFVKKRPNFILLNSRNFNRSDESIAGSIAHEFVHLFDNISKFRMGHPPIRWYRPFRNKKVRQSVPYVIGREFKQYLETSKP